MVRKLLKHKTDVTYAQARASFNSSNKKVEPTFDMFRTKTRVNPNPPALKFKVPFIYG